MTRVALLYVDDFFQPRSQRVGSLGLASIAAWLEREFPDCETRISITAEDVLSFEPDLVGISAYTETLPEALVQARWIKAHRDVPIVLGGPHISANPWDLRPEIDIGVVGEGEEAMAALVQALRENALVPSRLRQLPGFTFRDHGQLVQTGRCPELKPLDRLAHPDRRKMFAPLQARFSDFRPLFHVHTARGCPYRCTFCSAPLVNPSWRFHSPEWVVAELEGIARDYPDCDQITLSDDLFTLKQSRLEDLVRAIRAAGLHRRFFFLCSSRSNTLNADICKLLVDMNVLLVSFGLESGSDAIIRQLKGRGTSQADYARVLSLCQAYGLYAHGNFIIGDQHETQADLKATWDFLFDHRHQLATAYITHMTPFPGTQVWEEAIAAQRLDPDQLDYRLLNLEFDPERSVLLSPHYSRSFYTSAHAHFKRFAEALSARFTEESGLIKEVLAQERQDFPDTLACWLAELGWQRLYVVSPRVPPLPAQLGTCHITHCAPDQVNQVPEQTPLLLFHTLGSLRQPATWLATLPKKTLLSFDYHIGHYYHLILLLLGQWPEGCWGGREHWLLRHFTRKSLTQMMQQQGYQRLRIQPFCFRQKLPQAPLKHLQAIAPVPEPDTFAWLSLWEPLTPLGTALDNTA